jgi:hypothetical protein
MTAWIIYSLRRGNRDPFYVGSTNDWRRRLKEHKAFFGKGITLDLLEEGAGTRADRDAAEHYWIESFRQLGYKLANRTEGGDGGIETPSAETRARLSEAMKGRVFTAEHRAKIGKAHRGKTISQETRAKVSATLRKRFADPAMRREISDAMFSSLSPERRSEIALIGARALMKKNPEAHKTRMLDWWASMSPEERQAFIDRRNEAKRRKRQLVVAI